MKKNSDNPKLVGEKYKVLEKKTNSSEPSQWRTENHPKPIYRTHCFYFKRPPFPFYDEKELPSSFPTRGTN